MISEEQIASALNEIEIFGSSGLMLNRKKTTGDVGRKIKQEMCASQNMPVYVNYQTV